MLKPLQQVGGSRFATLVDPVGFATLEVATKLRPGEADERLRRGGESHNSRWNITGEATMGAGVRKMAVTKQQEEEEEEEALMHSSAGALMARMKKAAMHDEAGDSGGFKVRDDQGGQGGLRGMSGRRRCSKA